MTHNQIDDITIVGGGDAGLMATLLLEQAAPNINLMVIDDFQEDPPNVGKSTISYILNTFHGVLDIERRRFISEVKPVWKASAYFRDWCGCDPFHVPFDEFTLRPEQDDSEKFHKLYHRYQTDNYQTLGTKLTEHRRSPFMRQPNGSLDVYHHVAYHLGVERLNNFLRNICQERGIDLVDERITEVQTSNNTIEAIASETNEYRADLYLDATGLKRLLMGSLDNKFKSFDIPLDSAVVAKTNVELSEIVPATVIESGRSGWFWQIDTYDWRDVGYVYSSEHISDDAALKEFLNHRPESIAESNVQAYRFNSGVYKKAWVENCVAVGNALGFVEPLESTALTTNAILLEKAGDLIRDHARLNHDGLRDIYNTYATSLWSNLYDFISVHYRYADGDTPFWHEARTVNAGSRLKTYNENFQQNGFTSHREFNQWQFYQDNRFYRLFNQWQFYRLMTDLGVESKFYQDLDFDVPSHVVSTIETQNDTVAHKLNHCLTYPELKEHGIY
jgi:tryptophan halogenase